MKSVLKKIAVILEGRVQYERNVLRGIRDFAAKRDDWLIRLEFPGGGTADFIDYWQPDGVLYQSSGLKGPALQKLSAFPAAIHLSESPSKIKLNSVGLDNGEIGRLAADYFVERRFQHFAFVGTESPGFSETRGNSFQRRLKESGALADVIKIEKGTNESAVAEWLGALPKPCGLFATHDECALFLTTVCRSVGIQIPDDIGILGVDDDNLICELTWPQLSSISVPSKRVGYEAARQLDHWIWQESEKGRRELELMLPPTGVVTRNSTEIHRTADELVNRALQFMSIHSSRRINIEDVLREIGVSRRVLERKFSHQIGRSPLQELQRLRVAEARRLLLETRLPLQDIAIRCGVGDASRLVTVFRKEMGLTPGEFRSRS